MQTLHGASPDYCEIAHVWMWDQYALNSPVRRLQAAYNNRC
jgi:hypothetical protein